MADAYYFKFHVHEWLTGRIQDFDMFDQGIYINLVSMIWRDGGTLSAPRATIARRMRVDPVELEQAIDRLTAEHDEPILEQSENGDLSVRFLTDQAERMKGISEMRRKAALTRHKKRPAKRTPKPTPKPTPSKKTATLGFDEFWQAYPKKRGKKDALKAWVTTAKERPDTKEIIRVISEFKLTKDWTKDGGQFIPLPASWLRANRWDDQIDVAVPAVNGSVLDSTNPDDWEGM